MTKSTYTLPMTVLMMVQSVSILNKVGTQLAPSRNPVDA